MVKILTHKDVMKYYCNPNVMFKMATYGKWRECALYRPTDDMMIRFLKVCHSTNLKYLFKNSGMLDGEVFNFYASVGEYKDFKYFSYIGDPEKKEKQALFKKKSTQYMTGYDLFIDIDAKDTDEMHLAVDSALQVVQLFRRLNVPFYCRFSGMGFHFIVPYRFLKPYLPNHSFHSVEDNNIYRMYYMIASYLREHISEMCDKVVYDERRIIKIPFSLAYYDSQEIYCCLPLPLPERELKKFNRDNFHLSKINPHVFRNCEEPLHNKKGNCEKLINEVLRYG